MQARQVKVDVSNLVSYFIESVIHLYLYERNVYPRASFADFIAFGLHLKTCNNPDVKKYIFDCIESLRPQISEIDEFRVVIKSISASPYESKPVESLVLQFNKLNAEFIRQDICFSLLQEYFAIILIRLKIIDSFLQPLEFETTWEPWVHFCSSSNQNEFILLINILD
ncbi:unnamed protein product [Schistosoma rodhaini]|nr:unnamed protein product [Schistosoma rodhaini]